MSDAGKYFSRKNGLRDHIESGPLAGILDDYAKEMEASGYTPGMIQSYLRAARHVTWSLEHGGLRRSQLTKEGLQAFIEGLHRTCRCPYAEKRSNNGRSAMKRLLRLLQSRGLADPDSARPFADELAGFGEYLDEVRGVAEETRAGREQELRCVLGALMRNGRYEPRKLTTAAVNAYLLSIVEAGNKRKAHSIACTVRIYCRYLHASGRALPLDPASVRGPKIEASSPTKKALTLQQLRLLLRPLREDTALAARDFAVLLLLARTGLRRSDVARTKLDDFDARASTLCIRRNKSRIGHVVPLPSEVRRAILEYVGKYRRPTKCDALFLAEAFPYDTRLTPGGVTAIVTRAFRRSGIAHPCQGAHVLRHTVSTHLVASGAPLKAVADLLVHKSIDTTHKYVRVDMNRLRAVIRPWGGVPGAQEA